MLEDMELGNAGARTLFSEAELPSLCSFSPSIWDLDGMCLEVGLMRLTAGLDAGRGGRRVPSTSGREGGLMEDQDSFLDFLFCHLSSGPCSLSLGL